MISKENSQNIIDFCKKIVEEKITPGTSGNISVRSDRGFVITPSGISYDKIRTSDLVEMDLKGNILSGKRKPSSEWYLHLLFYKNRNDINAVVHLHSEYCCVFASLNRPLEAVHYIVADANTNVVKCAPYALFGSKELANVTVNTCGGDNAVLMANHGMCTLGKDLATAYSLAKNMEYLAKIQYRAECIGKPTVLSKEQIDPVLKAFNSYGQDKR